MEKTEKKRNVKTSDNTAKSGAKKRVTSPIEGATMISVPAAKNPYRTEENKGQNPFIEENNLENIVETINNFNTAKSYTKPKTTQLNETTNPISSNSNYFEIMKNISEICDNCSGIVDLFSEFGQLFTEKLKWEFVGFGLFHEKSKCLNIKLHSQAGNSYSSKIFLSDETNPIIKSFNEKIILNKDNIEYLNIPYLRKTPSLVVPLISVKQCIGVMIIGQSVNSVNSN